MRIAITRTDGGVSIMLLSQQSDGSWPDPQIEVNKWKELHAGATDGMHYLSHRFIGDGESFPDLSLMNAWIDNGSQIVVDPKRMPVVIKAQLAEIDAKSGMVRGLREDLLSRAAASPIFVAKIKAAEDQAIALRAQLAKV